MEEEFVANQERLKPQEEKIEEDRSKIDLRGSPMILGNLEEYYVGILSFVDKDQLEPGYAILMHNKKATYNFTVLIGQGAYGPVYKAQMLSGETVAVKVLATNSKQGEKEYRNGRSNFVLKQGFDN